MSTHSGSYNAKLLAMTEVGQRQYVEVTLENYAQFMRTANTPKSRRPKGLAGREFTATLLTAVGSVAGDIRYLVCIERVK